MAKRKKKFIMNGAEIIEALSAVTKEKNINLELAMGALKDALAQAARRGMDKPPHIGVDIDNITGEVTAYSYQKVVDDDLIEDIYGEIPLTEAREDVSPDLEIGDEVVLEENIDISEFGRSAIQIAKQIIMQRVREHERTKIFNDYSDRIGEMINGKIRQIEKGNVIIDLGRTEALLPRSMQIRGERFYQGGTVKGVIVEVKDNAKGAQVIISRTAPEFLERLFEIEVPEIFEGIIKINKIVRAPGYRAKVAVSTDDERVDPVGACVGMRGSRIQNIVREVNNERMDIIKWTDEISILVRRALAAADINRVIPVGDTKVVVIVDDEDLARAIGREGQNIRLTSEFIGREVEIYGESQFDDLSESQRAHILSSGEITSTVSDDDDDIIDDEYLGEDETHAEGVFESPIDQEDDNPSTEELMDELEEADLVEDESGDDESDEDEVK